MSPEQARSTRFLLWCALLLLSLRPLAPLDAALGWATAPLRLVSELAAPLRLLERRTLLAAERTLASTAAEEEEESVRLKRDLRRGAEPSDPALRAGRLLVGGEVRGRDPRDEDRILVRLTDVTGVVPGLPVVSGNAYVGRVVQVVADGVELAGGVEWGTATVELVTAAGFHVGAAVERAGADGRDVFCTVGGLHVTPVEQDLLPLEPGALLRRDDSGAHHLLLHNPSDRKLERGLARVHELFDDAETFADLSRGFVLGDVQRVQDGSWRIRPRVDYADGLFQVVVLVPERSGARSSLRPELVSDARWKVVRPLVAAVSSPWREAAVVNAGSLSGLQVGAAVTALGQRLVGRVSSVTPTSACVSFLGDPGFQVLAVARVEGLREPLVLGRLVSLGRDEETGEVRLRWLARVERALPGTESLLRARLFTGSGDPGLESGFFLGDALLPRAGGPARVVRLEPGIPPHRLRRLYARIDPGHPRGPSGGGGR